MAYLQLAEVVLHEHGVLRVVLPSAANGMVLLGLVQLASWHVDKLRAAMGMHIICRGQVKVLGDWRLAPIIGPPPEPDTQYLTAYTTALRSAVAATGRIDLLVISLLSVI